MQQHVNVTLTPRTTYAWQNANLWQDPVRRASIFARFWSQVNRADAKACWLFTGPIYTHGYGMFSFVLREMGIRQVRTRAHRFSWLASRGEIPAGYEVCHRCDQPRCVNPEHLFLGTHRDNHLDSVRKGRKHVWGLQKLNAEQVTAIRLRAAQGELHRVIAADFGMSRSGITGIVSGASWAHLRHAPQSERLSGLCEVKEIHHVLQHHHQ